ncbi:MAG: ERAP1-like C-terminal domain-containing protein, partial [Nocardioidaceae bacterium]
KDVREWAEAWLRTSGVDTLSTEIGADGRPVIHRRNGSPVETQRPHALTVTAYDDRGKGTSTPLLITGDTTVVPFEGVGRDGLLLPDSADETWAKIGLDDESLRRVPALLPRIDDPLARASIWGALREGLRDATIDPDLYLQTIEEALPHDSDLAVENILGGQFGGAISEVGRYFPTSEGRERLAAVATRLVDEAPPGSNRQLIAVRSLINLSTDPELLKGWISGDTTPDGVVADENFRWRLTSALCELDEFGLDEVAAEQQRDPSSQGALNALGCRAVLPHEDTKAGVWNSIINDRDLSNYELYALAEVFFRRDQTDLTASYTARYFEEIPGTAKIRTGWIVERTTVLGFPRFAVTGAALELAEQCLADKELDTGVRRSISDATDDLRRVVASRARFGR